METAIEAEAAIRSLHDKKLGPTAMRVKPAHTDEERKRRKKQAEVSYILAPLVRAPVS